MYDGPESILPKDEGNMCFSQSKKGTRISLKRVNGDKLYCPATLIPSSLELVYLVKSAPRPNKIRV